MSWSFYTSGGALKTGAGAVQVDYVEVSSNVTISGTSGAQTNVISGNSVVLEAVPYLLEFFCPRVERNPGSSVLLNFWVDSTDLGKAADYSDGNAGHGTPVYIARRYTPTAGTHQFHVKGWQSGGNVTAYAGAGGSATTFVPIFLRVTRAN